MNTLFGNLYNKLYGKRIFKKISLKKIFNLLLKYITKVKNKTVKKK